MSLTEYLAKNYLTADSAPKKSSKKRKRGHHADASGGVKIADDDISGSIPELRRRNEEDDDEDGPLNGTDHRSSIQNILHPLTNVLFHHCSFLRQTNNYSLPQIQDLDLAHDRRPRPLKQRSNRRRRDHRLRSS